MILVLGTYLPEFFVRFPRVAEQQPPFGCFQGRLIKTRQCFLFHLILGVVTAFMARSALVSPSLTSPRTGFGSTVNKAAFFYRGFWREALKVKKSRIPDLGAIPKPFPLVNRFEILDSEGGGKQPRAQS